ncbi:MAG: hypothetical protein WCK90_03455 [archaeon]
MPKSAKKLKVGRFVYWTPRILGIVFVLFLALFSLDVFGNGYTFWETVLGLLMHNIPSIALLIILIVAWKYEWVGAVAFILAGVAYIVMLAMNPIFEWYMISWSVIIAGPAFFIGILFYLNWVRKRNLKIKR